MATIRTEAEIQKEIDALKALAAATDDLVAKKRILVEVREEELAKMRNKATATVAEIEAAQKQIRTARALVATYEKQTEAGAAAAEGLGGLIGLNKDYESSMLGSITTTLSSAAAQQKFSEQMGKTFTAQNMAYSMLLKIGQATMKLALEQDAALVSFNKQTGAARLYGDELVALEQRHAMSGVTAADSAEALGGLVRTVHGLKTMSQSARTDLVETTGILQELGVSAETTGANVHFMSRSLGMSVKESSKYQRELLTLAQQIGMPPAEMAEGFKSAQPKLAAFGKDAGRVFKKLATAARASGMEVQQMLGIVEQFDTFEGAATSVGKLNALLGGPFLNSMEMVMQTDPTERMRMLSGALNKAGKSFDQLTYYEKKSIAAAAGLSDVNELALVMAGNFTGVAGGAQKSQAEIQRLAAQTKEFNEIGEELTQVVRMFAIEMKPVIGQLKEWIENFQKNKDEVQKILPAIAMLSGAVALLGGIYAATAITAMSMWTAIFAPIAFVAVVVASGYTLYHMFGNLEFAMAAATIVATGLFVALGLLTWPVALTVSAIASLGAILWYGRDAVAAFTAEVKDLIYWLFEKTVGSFFTEAITNIGIAFLGMGTGVGVVTSALSMMIGVVAKLIGSLFSSDITNSSFYKGIVSIGSALGLVGSESDALLSKQSRSSSSPRAAVAAEQGTRALNAADNAASRSAYVSNSPEGITKSGASATSTAATAAQEVVVKLALGPLFSRYFTADQILSPINKALNAVTEGTS